MEGTSGALGRPRVPGGCTSQKLESQMDLVRRLARSAVEGVLDLRRDACSRSNRRKCSTASCRFRPAHHLARASVDRGQFRNCRRRYWPRFGGNPALPVKIGVDWRFVRNLIDHARTGHQVEDRILRRAGSIDRGYWVFEIARRSPLRRPPEPPPHTR